MPGTPSHKLIYLVTTHTASAVTLYGSIAIVIGMWRGRRYLIGLLTLTALIAPTVAFCRMYRGFHYPTDVMAGALIGIIWMSAVYLAMRPLPERGVDHSELQQTHIGHPAAHAL